MTLLISVLVMGAIAIVVGSSVAVRGIEEVDVGRSTVQTAEALAAADACVEEALLQIKRGIPYTGGILPIGDGSCSVVVTGAEPTFVIRSSGSVLQWTREIGATATFTGSTVQKVVWSAPSSSSSSSVDSCNDPLYECTADSNCIGYPGGQGDACDLNICCGLTINTCKTNYVGCSGGAVECRSGTCYNNGGNPMAKTCICQQTSSSSAASSVSSAVSSTVYNPTILTYVPAPAAINVAVGQTLSLQFTPGSYNTAMVPQSGGSNSISIYRYSDDVLFEAIAADSAQVTTNGTDTVYIDPVGTLDPGTQYYVLIGVDAFDDMGGNSYAGIGVKTTWSFTTAAASSAASSTASIATSSVGIYSPVVATYTPTPAAINILSDALLILSFSPGSYDTAMVPQSLGSNSISIYRYSDDVLFETIAADSAQVTTNGNDEVYIDPIGVFDFGTQYYVLIGTDAFDDMGGNSYVGIGSKAVWYFTIAPASSSSSLPVVSSSISSNPAPPPF